MNSFSRIILIINFGLLLHAIPLFGQWEEDTGGYLFDSLYRAGIRSISVTQGDEMEMSSSMHQNDTGLYVESKTISASLSSHTLSQYNKKDLIVKSTSQMKSFDRISKHIELYEYNKNDSIIEKKTLYEGEETSKTQVKEIIKKYSYDITGRLIQVKEFADDKLKLTCTLKYNAKGKLVEKEQVWEPIANNNIGAFGEKVRKEMLSYDSLERVVSYKMLKDDSLSESTTYSYIEGISRVTTVKSSPSWLESKTSVTVFDSTGKEIERVKYGSDNMLASLTLKRYNAKGKLAKEIIYSKGLLSSWAETLYFYNANDDLVRKEMRGKDEPLVDLYEYDSRGNITQEISMAGEKILNTTKYTYTYAK